MTLARRAAALLAAATCLAAAAINAPALPAADAAAPAGAPVRAAGAAAQAGAGAHHTVPSGATATPLTGHSISLTVADVSPSTPRASYTKQVLTVVLTLHNTTNRTLRVQLSADRGDPISSQSALDRAIAHPRAPSADLVAHIATEPNPITVVPAGTADYVFRVTTDIPRDAQLCLCHDAIYPLYFTATTVASATTPATTVGSAQTYLPVFGKTTAPAPVQVSWVWPLLDRPHRLTESATGTPVFLDDALAGEVAPGGRLDRMLSVVERTAGRVRLTLVLDPELIDELAVMSAGTYRVRALDATTATPGTGSAAAASWLQRLRSVLDTHPGIELDFTPFADPDVQSLSEHGMSWSSDLLSPAALARVTAALGSERTPLHDIAWPVGETLSATTLAELVRQGTRTVLLNSATLPGSAATQGASALSQVQTPAGTALAAVTSAGIERFTTRVLARTGAGLGELPQLVSEVAIRVITSLHRSHFVVITPPRFLDTDPDVAVRAMLATAHASWSRSLGLRAATTTVAPVDRGAPQRRHTRGLPGRTLNNIDYVTQSLPGMTGMFGQLAAARLLGPLPTALQRTASVGLVDLPGRSITESAQLAGQVSRLLAGVSLVRPANGAYTLTASDSSIPITIRNTLGVPVRVRVGAHAANGLPGFTADPLPVQTIAAGSTEQVKVPTHIVRTGRIEVVVTLDTPRGMPLGDNLPLIVRSTALGTVGVAITTAAGVVLVLALLVRTVGYLRRRNKPRVQLRTPDDITV